MLDMVQVMRLRRAGFIDYEIAQYNYMVAADGSPQMIDLNTATWQATLKTRRNWVDARRAEKWTDQEIYDAIMGYYKGRSQGTPFDFLKAVYLSEQHHLGNSDGVFDRCFLCADVHAQAQPDTSSAVVQEEIGAFERS